jgi:serine/threonine protein phosphatase PrpC
MDSFGIVSSAVSDRGLSEKRPENEDSYLEMPERGVFAVADGVGGAQAGEVASQMAMEILGEAFANQADVADAEDTLKAAIERANTAIFRMANELPQLSSMATTIAALHLAGDIATIGHVGDSRLYRVDRDGNLHRETSDHSMVADEVRAGRMTEEQAETHPNRNIISRALGAEGTVEVDLKTIMIEPGTAFLICSDGVTRHVSDEEIRGVLTFGGAPADICDYLKNLCYERGAEDNLTAVVIKVGAVSAAAEATRSIVPPITTEEATVATARSPFESEATDEALLELDTRELGVSTPGELSADAEPTREMHASAAALDNFSMSGRSEPASEPSMRSDSVGKIALALGMFVLGSLIGLAVYHFTLGRADSGGPGFQEMKTENIPFTTFEKNRRNVDADPAEYIKEVPQPEDAEDFYLRGRALILLGDFPNAHVALVEAQKRLPDADQANAKVLANDIETALLITNDPSIQKRLRPLPAPTTPSSP